MYVPTLGDLRLKHPSFIYTSALALHAGKEYHPPGIYSHIYLYVRSLNAHQIRVDEWRAQALNRKSKLLFIFGVLAEVLPQEAVQEMLC